MAFEPLYGRVITENCENTIDFIITGEVLVDGTIRVSPTIFFTEPNEWGFDKVTWDYTQLIDSGNQLLTEGWVTGDDPVYLRTVNYDGWYSSFGNWPHDYATIVGREQTPTGGYGTGEVHEVSYTGEDWASVDNAAGWTAEFTFYIPISPSGRDAFKYHSQAGGEDNPLLAAQGGYWYFDFDDGTKAGRIFFNPFNSILVPSVHEKRVHELLIASGGDAFAITPIKNYGEYTLYPRTLRLTVKGDEVWITTNAGIRGSTSYSPAADGSSAGVTPQGTPYIGSISYVDANSWVVLGSGPTAPAPNSPTVGYPQPGTPTGLENGSVYGPDGAAGFYYSGLADRAPPSQREPIQPWDEQFNFHVRIAGFAATSGTKKVGFYHDVKGETKIGMGNAGSVLMLNSFKVDRAGYPLIEHEVYTGDYITYTPELQPIYPVGGWSKAFYSCIIPSSGETYITPQYYDSAAWLDHGVALAIVSGEHTVDLSGILPSGDLTDRMRFKVQQTSAAPSGEPPRVDFIKVAVTPIPGDFSFTPNYGPTTGENWVTLNWIAASGSFADAQPVYVGALQVPTGDVVHVDTETKQIKMPAQAAGNYFIEVIGSSFWSSIPYTYVESYEITNVPTGELEVVFGNTRSPFRVLTRPPDHAVNLALVGTTPVSVGTHMSLVNLSDREPSNLTGYGIQEDSLYNGISGDFLFLDAVDTADVLLSNKAAMWRNLGSPTPLFYKYLLGRDRFYVHAPEATGVTDLESIRTALTISEDGGLPPSFKWDIEASLLDAESNTLPSGVYAVVIFVDTISPNTMWVTYRGIDRLSEYESAGTRREIINPVPLFDLGPGRMGFTVALSSSGSYDVTVEV